jgi:hypothetical protein
MKIWVGRSFQGPVLRRACRLENSIGLTPPNDSILLPLLCISSSKVPWGWRSHDLSRLLAFQSSLLRRPPNIGLSRPSLGHSTRSNAYSRLTLNEVVLWRSGTSHENVIQWVSASVISNTSQLPPPTTYPSLSSNFHQRYVTRYTHIFPDATPSTTGASRKSVAYFKPSSAPCTGKTLDSG